MAQLDVTTGSGLQSEIQGEDTEIKMEEARIVNKKQSKRCDP